MKRPVFSLLLALALGWSSAVNAGDFEEGRIAFEAGDYATAFREFSELANAGDVWAQSLLGSMYNDGLGVKQDYAEGAKWLRRAAEQGNAAAQHDLAMSYLKGLGVSQDFSQAVKWLRRAAEQGLAESQGALGKMYEDGLGVPRDQDEAVNWLRRAADQGNVLAQKDLANIQDSPMSADQILSTGVSENLEYHIIQQLRCLEKPEPIFTLLALKSMNKIKTSEMIGYDSISCFRINGGIDINGLKFVSVCGHSEDHLVRKLFPDILWRGPGTSPGQFISFGTNVNFEIAARWYLEQFGPDFLNQAIKTERTHMGDQTAITCSSWMR